MNDPIRTAAYLKALARAYLLSPADSDEEDAINQISIDAGRRLGMPDLTDLIAETIEELETEGLWT